MPTIKEYFCDGLNGALLHPIRRGESDRRYIIGRIIQSLLISGVMFALYCAITDGLGDDPIKLFEDNIACQLSASAIGGLALAYIIWGARGAHEFEQLEETWAREAWNKNPPASIDEF